MLTVSISQEREEYGEYEDKYYVTVSYDNKRYEKYYTFIPDFETVKSDFEIFKEDFTLIKS